MKISNEELKVAIIGSSAIMRDILDRVNEGKKESEQITIQGLHQRIKESPEFSELMAREKDEIDDIGETQFTKALKAGEKWAIQGWLKYRGRERGYVERQELTGKGGKDLPAAKTEIIYVPAGDYARVAAKEATERADEEYPIDPEQINACTGGET